MRTFAAVPCPMIDMDEDAAGALASVADFVTRVCRCLDESWGATWPKRAPELFDVGEFVSQADLSQIATARAGAAGHMQGFDVEIERIATRLLTFDAYEEGHLWTVRMTARGLWGSAKTGSTSALALSAEANGLGSVDITVDAPSALLDRVAALVAPLQVRARLKALYGVEGTERIAPRIDELMARTRRERTAPLGPAGARVEQPPFDERSGVLIAYPDHLTRANEAPLQTLARFCERHLADVAGTVHVLPFHPSTSYEGYAISDYRAVDAALGTWDDVSKVGAAFSLMFDLVLNHCSAKHPWFQQLLADEEPGRRYFIRVDDPSAPWIERVLRARNHPLLTRVETRAGPTHVWTTYSADLVDLDWREPDVCVEMIDLLLDAVERGARIVRLDAYGYVWKTPDTNCVNRPELYELLKLFQDVLGGAGAPDVALLPSITNVTHGENSTHFPLFSGHRQADLLYLLPLSGLLLSALTLHDARPLRTFLTNAREPPAGCAYLLLATGHDGIGLSWLKNQLPAGAIDALIEAQRARGALLSMRSASDGEPAAPWEINATWFSACAPDGDEAPERHVDRMVATLGALLSLRGVPALYLPSLFAARTDLDRAAAHGDARAANRARFRADDVEALLTDSSSEAARTFRRVTALWRARREHAAFSPAASQQVLAEAPDDVLLVARTPEGAASGAAGSVLCAVSFASAPRDVAIPAPFAHARGLRDLITGDSLTSPSATLPPYAVRWWRVET